MNTFVEQVKCGRLGRMAVLLIGAVVWATGLAWGQNIPLAASPDIVSFSRMDDSKTIQLTYGDAPLPAEQVKSTRVMIDDRDYSEQFVITRSSSGAATVTIRPNPATAQVGSFTLRIATVSGEVQVAVLTPFDALPDLLENQAKAKGMTVQQLKAQLGMVKRYERSTLAIQLPKTYPEGHAFEVNLPNGSDNEFTWTVDGAIVEQGAGKSTLSHVFEKAGEHVLSVVEKKGEGIVASWEGVLKVVAAEPMTWSVPAKTQITVPGPGGFKKYTWRVDGKDVSTMQELKYTFPKKGQAIIECVAEQPEKGNPAEFRRLTWNTTVK